MSIEGLLRIHGHDMRQIVGPDGKLVYVERGRLRRWFGRIIRTVATRAR